MAHGDFVLVLLLLFFYGPANMTHKLSYARAEMITSYHLPPQQICFTHKLESVTSRFCGLVAVFLLCGFCLLLGFVLVFLFCCGSLFFGFGSPFLNLERD